MLKHSLVRTLLIILIFVSLVIFVSLYFFSERHISSKAVVASPQSISEKRTSVIISPTPKLQNSPSPSPKAAPSVRPSPNKDSYTIAAFGDSMVDTMGENLDYLDKAMMARYPTTKFKFYNYGIGSQNIVEAGKRFGDAFVYKERNYPPIDKINADIIIISSFAYNPLVPFDKNAYLTALKEVITRSKNIGPKVYLLAEIAPLKDGFGKGVGGVNWDEEKTRIHVSYILQNLDSATNLAAQTNTALINVYKKSQTEGKYGNKIYVGSHDGIHPSVEGEVFMADVIAETLKLP